MNLIGQLVKYSPGETVSLRIPLAQSSRVVRVEDVDQLTFSLPELHRHNASLQVEHMNFQ